MDALASSARPPAGIVDRSAGIYGLLGARAQWSSPLANLSGAGYFGMGARQQDGRWGALSLTASRDRDFGPALGDLEVELFGLRYRSPQQYTAMSVSGRPGLHFRIGSYQLSTAAELGAGFWNSRIELEPEDATFPVQPPGPTAMVTNGQLRLGAFRANIAAPLSRGSITLGGVIANTVNGRADGTYGGASLSVLQVRNAWDFALETQLLSGPRPTEAGWSARIGRFVGEGLYVSVEVSRNVTEIALGAPGHTGATVGASWRPGNPPTIARPALSVVKVGSREDQGTRVEFRLPKTAASSVALIGSFTEWQPRSMDRTPDGWTISMVLPEGSHQFAFLLDGQRWYLPDGAPGVIDDGYGRRNASVVIGL
ncbi:MAG: hypothetical protein ACREMA_09280 [Longimicrobiales bacterium]